MDLKGAVALVTAAMAGWGSASATRWRRRACTSPSCMPEPIRRGRCPRPDNELPDQRRRVRLRHHGWRGRGKTDRRRDQTLRPPRHFGERRRLQNKAIPFTDLDNLTLEVWTRSGRQPDGADRLTKAVAPIMKAQGRGRVVNISSVAGLGPQGSSIAYAVSKAGLIHLTRVHGGGDGPETLVNCVAPGLLEGTRATANLRPEMIERSAAGSLLKKAADKDDCADMVVTMCRTETMTGQTVVIDSDVRSIEQRSAWQKLIYQLSTWKDRYDQWKIERREIEYVDETVLAGHGFGAAHGDHQSRSRPCRRPSSTASRQRTARSSRAGDWPVARVPSSSPGATQLTSVRGPSPPPCSA